MTVKPSEWKNGTMPSIDVVDARMDDLLDRLDVGADVVMREHDALGHAGRAGGEDDRQHVVAADFGAGRGCGRAATAGTA